LQPAHFRFGGSLCAYGGIERGERNVSFTNLLRIADALDVRPSELMDRYERCLHVASPQAPRRRAGPRV
jgi:transcriptional regulator with XRE-family HTH domain